MEFTCAECLEIRHALEVVEQQYLEQMRGCEESGGEDIIYQIYNRLVKDTREMIERIENAVLWDGETI